MSIYTYSSSRKIWTENTHDLELKYISPQSRLAKSFGSIPPPKKKN